MSRCHLHDERCGDKCTLERCIIGKAPKLREILSLIRGVVCTDTTVLLLGESGTGKELMAQAIHYNSHRARGRFVAINCASFPENLLESELFGYERGAFTSADTAKPGQLELAQGGTLFLDEIGDMSLPVQAKFLRFLEERRFMRLGGTVSLKSNIRIISATNKDLFKLIGEGKFRSDLIYRINVFPVTLPPLRERKEDIPLLTEHFVRKFSVKIGKEIKKISKSAVDYLCGCRWVGNVRELQNAIERAVILCQNGVIEKVNLILDVLSKDEEAPLKAEPAISYAAGNGGKSGGILSKIEFIIPPEGMLWDEFEHSVILQALKRCAYNKTKAAQLIGLSRSKFRYRLKKHRLLKVKALQVGQY